MLDLSCGVMMLFTTIANAPLAFVLPVRRGLVPCLQFPATDEGAVLHLWLRLALLPSGSDPGVVLPEFEEHDLVIYGI
jgi:hypothetical protein